MKIQTRVLIAVLLLTLGVSLSPAQDKLEKFTMNFDVSAGSTLDLSSIAGNVRISGWDQKRVSIVAVKRAKGTDAERKLALVKVSANLRGGDRHVVCEAQWPSEAERRKAGISGNNFNVSVDWTLNIPMDCSVDISQLISGELEMNDVSGRVDVNMISGNLNGKNISGKVKLDVTSGNITIDGLHGDAHLETISGDVKLSKVTGSSQIQSTSGGITVDAIDLEGLEIATTSGDVTISVNSPVTFGKYKIRAFSGDVEMTMPTDSAFSFYGKADNGEITSVFPLEIKRTMHRQTGSGKVGGGGADISINTFHGDITLKK